MKNQACLFTVVYPGCEPFLNRFFDSLRQQTVQEFDILIFNDGVKNLDMFTRGSGLDNRIQEVSVSGTIPDIRRQGIRFFIDSTYDNIIFADADDYFSETRVSAAIQALKHVDIYVNEVLPVSSQEDILSKSYFSGRLGGHAEILSSMIVDKNMIGLGNSSVKKEILEDIHFPPDLIAVDWMLFTHLLLKGHQALFKNDSVTYYRQHDRNTAGFKSLNEERVRRGIKVQIQNATRYASVSHAHMLQLIKMEEVNEYINRSREHLSKYIRNVKKIMPEFPFWWEEIQPLDQLSL